jgi:choline dehydrogenase-like flavoprotein
MVSGIGPAATLQSNGIDVLADRPGVGQNMWDHVFFGPSHVVDTVTHNFLGDPEFSAASTEEYIKNRNGILTNVGGDLLGKLQMYIVYY